MKLRNPNGRVVSVTQEMYRRYRSKKGWSEVEVSKGTSYPIKDETGSWYTLSDGSRIQGQENAEKAQAELNDLLRPK